MFDFELCRESCTSRQGQCQGSCKMFGEQLSNATAEDSPVQEADAPILSATSERMSKQDPQGSSAKMDDINPKWMSCREWDGGWPPPTVLIGPPPKGVSLECAPEEVLGMFDMEEASQQPQPSAASTSNAAAGRQISPSPPSDAGTNNVSNAPSGKSRKELPPDTRTCFGGCIYSPVANMNEVEVLKKAFWCTYCCCGGLGCHRWPAHLRLMCKCIACRQTFESTDCHGVHDGLCTQAHTCCCCLSICHMPPRKGTPRCILCNETFCGYSEWGKDAGDDQEGAEHNVASDGMDARVGDLDHFLDETSVLCYSCCTGFSVVPVCEAYHGKYKCCCCKCRFASACPCDGDGCCNCLLTCWWCLAQSRFPPTLKPDLNPLIGCCGCKLRKCCRVAHTIGPHGPGSQTAAPRQQEMQ